jgi:hypothetical protein
MPPKIKTGSRLSNNEDDTANLNSNSTNNNGRSYEESTGDGEERRVRQNCGVPRTGAFRPHVPISLENFKELHGRNTGVRQTNRFDPSRAQVVSLQSHVHNGPEQNEVILAMILNIKRESPVETQKIFTGNNHGKSKPKSHDRRVLFMCLNSDPGFNTFVMFQGSSVNEGLFNGDLSLRDNGGMREFLFLSLVITC